MNLRGALCCGVLWAFALSLSADSTPTLDLFAGWAWTPYPVCYPYAYGYPFYPYGWGPAVGLEHPLAGAGNEDRLGVYDPYWGLGYGVRYRLWPRRKFLDDAARDAFALPGAAPTEPRSAEFPSDWDLAVESFIKSPQSAATNAAPFGTSAPP